MSSSVIVKITVWDALRILWGAIRGYRISINADHINYTIKPEDYGDGQ